MGDTTWKQLERRFGRVWAELLGMKEPFRRNDARLNADDSTLNSDVDIIHTLLETGPYRGLVGECRHIKGGDLGYIQKTLVDITKEVRKTNVIPLVIMNQKYVCHWLRHGYQVWQYLVDEATGLSPITMVKTFHIAHIKVNYSATVLEEKMAQVKRYAKSKELYPAVCLGFHRLQPVEIFDLTYDGRE